jgi:hypothetical protein
MVLKHFNENPVSVYLPPLDGVNASDTIATGQTYEAVFISMTITSKFKVSLHFWPFWPTVRRRRRRHRLPLALALARRSLPVFREQRDCNIAILYPQLVNDAQPRRTAVHAEAPLATD